MWHSVYVLDAWMKTYFFCQRVILFFFTEVQLIYNVLVSGVQQTGSVLLQLITRYRIQFPMVQTVDLAVYLFYAQQCVSANPKVLNLSLPTPFPFGNPMFVFYVCESVPLFKFICILFQIPYKSDITCCWSFSIWFTQCDNLQVHLNCCKWHYFIQF